LRLPTDAGIPEKVRNR